MGHPGPNRGSDPGYPPGTINGRRRAAGLALSLAAGAVLAVLVVGQALSAHAASRPKVAGEPGLRPLIRPGEKAPAFSLRGLDGKSYSFRPGDGKPALLVFWSAFCPLCRELTPVVGEIAKRHPGDLRLVSVNLDGKRFSNAVSAFVRELGIDYPVLLDDIRNDLFVASDPYGVEKTPTAVLVDAAGVVRGAYAAERMRLLAGSFERLLLQIKKPAAGGK